jgi:hypothetical protein
MKDEKDLCHDADPREGGRGADSGWIASYQRVLASPPERWYSARDTGRDDRPEPVVL